RRTAVGGAGGAAGRARRDSMGGWPPAAAGMLDQVPEPGDPVLAVDVRDVLARLSPEHRAVLTLRELEGLDEKAVSEMLAVREGTVKSRLHRARRSFAKAWQQ